MELIRTDIDKLLESTMDVCNDEFHMTLMNIEIDKLLENTQDW